MADNQPRDFDVVQGYKAVFPVTGAVLGGLEGVKKRWESSDIKVKLAALSDALNYGDAGLDLVIEALQSSSFQISKAASELILEKADEEGRGALLGYEPWLFFTTLKEVLINFTL